MQRLSYIVGMRIGNLILDKKVICAPLAGISNRPFRVLAIKAGAALVFTEMISSEGIIRHQEKTLSMMKFHKDEQPLGIQLFGSNPESLKRAAEITAKDFKPDVIDINFGCPVKKVVSKNGGSAVLKDLKLTEELIRATIEGAGDIPVFIKIRTGWDDNAPVFQEVGKIAEKAGVSAITLHARSRTKGFSGKAQWESIKELKDSINIPVIGNGDIKSPEDAVKMFDQTGCDMVMLGRAAMSNPFIFQEIDKYFETGKTVNPPTIEEKIDLCLTHARLMIEEFGIDRGLIMMRRYFAWYIKGFPGVNNIRPKLFQVKTFDDIYNIFNEYLGGVLTR